MTTEATVKERPILFSGPMVRAILDGRKTQTRRVAKPPVKARFLPGDLWKNDTDEPGTAYLDDGSGRLLITCPYGTPGDRLWVREAWRCNHFGGLRIEYKAGGACLEHDRWPADAVPPYALPTTPASVRRPERQLDGERIPDVWRPSIHMPRWASRITLEVTGVRVERLQAISEEDAVAEGARRFDDVPLDPIHALDPAHAPRWSMGEPASTSDTLDSARWAFANLWDKLNGKTHPWASDPWVWVVEYRRLP